MEKHKQIKEINKNIILYLYSQKPPILGYNMYMKITKNKPLLPQFKSKKQIMEHIISNGIKLHFSETEHFGYHNGKNIYINRFLDNDVMTFIITHELAHIAAGEKTINNFSLKIEDADEQAVMALKKMNKNGKDSFSFKYLLNYSYFGKLKDIVKQEI